MELHPLTRVTGYLIHYPKGHRYGGIWFLNEDPEIKSFLHYVVTRWAEKFISMP